MLYLLYSMNAKISSKKSHTFPLLLIRLLITFLGRRKTGNTGNLEVRFALFLHLLCRLLI